MNHNKVAETICQRNQGIVYYVHANPESCYQGVRKALNRSVASIAKTHNEGKFVTSKDLHALTWAVINVANGDVDSDIPTLEV